MTEHKDIQNPDDYDADDYREYENLLLSPYTQVEKLEEICMTLAHLPTKQAQDLLAKFRHSERAAEVEWLECAVDEGRDHYLSPLNEQEDRDWLALKVMQEIEDKIIELEVEYNKLDLEWRKREIEREATAKLIKKNELNEDEALGFPEIFHFLKTQMANIREELAVKNKLFDQIKSSIKTERYKDVDTMYMRSVEFT